MSVHSSRPRAANPAILALLPIIAVAFSGLPSHRFALPVLPLHVHESLGLSTFVVGLLAGNQFAASLVSRGHHVDRRGPSAQFVTRLLIAAAAGLFYLLSFRFLHDSRRSVRILLPRCS